MSERRYDTPPKNKASLEQRPRNLIGDDALQLRARRQIGYRRDRRLPLSMKADHEAADAVRRRTALSTVRPTIPDACVTSTARSSPSATSLPTNSSAKA